MKNLVFALICFVLIAGLSACGKKEDTSSGSSTKETTTETTKEKTVKTESSGNMSLSAEEVAPGEDIIVTYETEGDFSNNGWIGIIPSDVSHGDETENDKHDVSYRYIKDKSGKFTFKAPVKPGSYDFRMHNTDNNGKEVSYVSFTVTEEKDSKNTGKKISLKTDKRSYKTGEDIEITYTAPDSWSSNAWIGIIPSDVPHGDETENDKHDVAYRYLQKNSSGTITIKAPGKPGSYDVRMHDTDKNGKEVKYVSIKVR